MNSMARWVEVHRLAVAGHEPTIARDLGHRVGRVWLRTSRFADVAALARATLTLGPDAGAFYDLGWAESSTGRVRQALTAYGLALDLYRSVGHRGNEAATLSNIGRVHDRLGDRQQALDHYHQALTLRREVGDRTGEAITRYNIAMIHRANGDIDAAIDELEQVVELDRQVGHPDLESDTAMLEKLRQQRAETRRAI